MEIMKIGVLGAGVMGNGIAQLASQIGCSVVMRDVDNEFAGAEFRDEETKILFACDYRNRHAIRVRGGANIKVVMYNELKRLGVVICDRVMATSLLTEGGKPGTRVIGATGVNVRTGEFNVFKAKATVLCTADVLRLWLFNTELVGLACEHNDPNNNALKKMRDVHDFMHIPIFQPCSFLFS